MKYLKIYEDFNDIHSICREYGIMNYTIVDGKVNVDGNVNLSDIGLTKLPISFGVVTGNFFCHYNKLTSLEGCPSSIGGNFNCNSNQLTKLKGGPNNVGGDFDCYDNKLTTLEGCPRVVTGDFYCSRNRLTTLDGCPSSLGGYFDCSNNQLTSLEGFPESIGGDYFDCSGNPIYELYSLFDDYSKVELFNYMDIIYNPREGDNRPVIYLAKLNSFLEEIDKPKVTKLKNYNCL